MAESKAPTSPNRLAVLLAVLAVVVIVAAIRFLGGDGMSVGSATTSVATAMGAAVGATVAGARVGATTAPVDSSASCSAKQPVSSKDRAIISRESVLTVGFIMSSQD